MTTLATSVGTLTEERGLDVVRLSLHAQAIENPQTGFCRRLRRPITLRAVKCPKYWMVSARLPLAHGTAPDLENAVADFMRDWEDRLRWLEEGEREGTLSPGALHELQLARRLMV